MKLDNALNFTEYLGDSSDSVRRLLEDHKKKDSEKTLSPFVVWQRGQDLNLRPPGYEFSDRGLVKSIICKYLVVITGYKCC